MKCIRGNNEMVNEMKIKFPSIQYVINIVQNIFYKDTHRENALSNNNSCAYIKYEYGHFGSCCIKSII